MIARAFGAACALLVAACSTDETLRKPDPHLNRMLEQPKVRAFDADPRRPGVAGMRAPPPFAVARGAIVDDEARAFGTRDGTFVSEIPLGVTRALLEEGRARFEVVCATCHGIDGDGISVVAEKMQARQPPSLVALDARRSTPGRLFATITEGYGYMPSFAAALSPDERWAVIAYREALALSRAAKLAELPEDDRAKIAEVPR